MTDAAGEKKKGMPLWAKILIGLVVLSIVGTISLVIGGAVVLQKVYHEAQDPTSITRVANEMATYSSPLPAGYRYVMGIGMMGIDLLTIEHKPDQQLLILMSYPEKSEQDPNKLVDKIYEAGINTPQASAKFQAVKTKGTMEVGGQQMPYIVGDMTDQTGNKFQGMVGCIIIKDKQKSIMLYGIQPPGKDYNLAVSEGFLKTIKSL